MKKLICLAFTLMLIFQTTIFAQAKNSEYGVNCDKIIEALKANEYIKTQIGLKDVDFSDFNYSSPIYSYNLEEDGPLSILHVYTGITKCLK